ncbi:MAG: homoaconitase [Chloroflexi bacterium]|uniref:Homoaconitase, mitochondrial n=1 Tax=Candidatus Chlorohelix allophototropha TaxID=3003348 RepID=A0A8T7LYH5_9CHLR|nr:homoaconitase [Chloroflexota bacterium]WJW67244.1 homoaconitase [Chloroflexota bacterium L227-S17]
MGQTLIEKIVQRYAVGLKPGQKVYANDFVLLKPQHVMTHDNTGAVIPKFESMGASGVFDSKQPVFALDHDVQNKSKENLGKYTKIETFARKQEIAFFPAGTGIAHQVITEEGFVLPGTVVVGSDSHSNLYGALACVGTPVVRTDAAAIWATGQTWWQIPEIIKVEITGKLGLGVTGKDVILALIGTFANDEVLNACLEFTGEGIASLTMSQRKTIANMTTEWGALAGVFPYDSRVRDYLLNRVEFFEKRGDQNPRITRAMIDETDCMDLKPDLDAYYAKEIIFDLGSVTPTVAGPNEVKAMVFLPELEQQRIKIDKAYLLSCVNSRLDDIEEAAAVVKNRKFATGVKFYLAAASAQIEQQAKELGYWQTLVEAGAQTLTAGCGPCIGLGEGVLEPGEVAISATNRNYKGRMGSPGANVYLASPAVVAASALEGYICGTQTLPSRPVVARLENRPRQNQAAAAAQDILPGFPTVIEGELLFVPKDNMNTDAIYGKEYTYNDNLLPAEMATKAFLNYDPEFQQITREGDILAGGWNFGSGSSREQAATTLKYRGLQLVIAGSYSQTYKRNAFNNGYIALECPELINWLKEKFNSSNLLTIRTGINTRLDFVNSEIHCGERKFGFSPLGAVAQRLVITGGFEQLIQEQIKSTQKAQA